MSVETAATAASSGANATERFRSDKSVAAEVSTERVNLLASRAIKALVDTVKDEGVTYDEYNALKSWLIKVGEDGEWPLFLDVWIEHAVEEVANADREGSKGTIEGPYYVPGSPVLDSPAPLPMRDDEPGVPLVFQGRVTGVTGEPLAGAHVEIWHADDLGFYSQFAPRPSPVESSRYGDRGRGGLIPDQHRTAGAVPDPYRRRLRSAHRCRRLASLATGPSAPQGQCARIPTHHHPALLHRRRAPFR